MKTTQKIRELKILKRKKSLFLKIAVLSLIIYISVALVTQQIAINAKNQQLLDLQEQIRVQDMKNNEMRHVLDSNEEENKDYIERIARESLNLADPSEKVFINVIGN